MHVSCNEPKLITYFKSQTGQAVPSTCKADGQATWSWLSVNDFKSSGMHKSMKTCTHILYVCDHSWWLQKHTSRVSKSCVPSCRRFNLILHVSLRNIKLFRFCLTAVSGEEKKQELQCSEDSHSELNTFHNLLSPSNWVPLTETEMCNASVKTPTWCFLMGRH